MRVWLIIMLALLFVSCKTSKEVQEVKQYTYHNDSTHVVLQSKIDTVIVEARQDSSSILLTQLIEQGEFKQNNNGVQTIIKYRDDHIHAECICDEIEHLVVSTLEKHFKQLTKVDNKEQKEAITQRKNNWLNWLGLLFGLLFFALVIIKFKIW